MKRILKIVGIIVIGLIILGWIFGSKSGTSTSTSTGSTGSANVTAIRQMCVAKWHGGLNPGNFSSTKIDQQLPGFDQANLGAPDGVWGSGVFFHSMNAINSEDAVKKMTQASYNQGSGGEAIIFDTTTHEYCFVSDYIAENDGGNITVIMFVQALQEFGTFSIIGNTLTLTPQSSKVYIGNDTDKDVQVKTYPNTPRSYDIVTVQAHDLSDYSGSRKYEALGLTGPTEQYLIDLDPAHQKPTKTFVFRKPQQ